MIVIFDVDCSFLDDPNAKINIIYLMYFLILNEKLNDEFSTVTEMVPSVQNLG